MNIKDGDRLVHPDGRVAFVKQIRVFVNPDGFLCAEWADGARPSVVNIATINGKGVDGDGFVPCPVPADGVHQGEE